MMNYSDITFKDKNPIKRWLQNRRLITAVDLAKRLPAPKVILDFGSGNGELCKLIAVQFPAAKIICYEPTPNLLAEAKENLADLAQVEFRSDLKAIAQSSIDIVFCLEVFEHLPPLETAQALSQIDILLHDNGSSIIGVPVEIGFPALYKGVFRMSRRLGEFDASLKNVLSATFGILPKQRPVSIITPKFSYHFYHLGFDYRDLRMQLSQKFSLQKITSSPFSILGLWINPEAYFVVKKKALR
jgi:SAM-dependent methyltransferase